MHLGPGVYKKVLPLLAGEGDGTKQPTGEIWIPQHSVHGLTRPRKCISFQLARNNRTPNLHLPEQNWTIIIMNTKTSPHPSQGMTKGNTQDLVCYHKLQKG